MKPTLQVHSLTVCPHTAAMSVRKNKRSLGMFISNNYLPHTQKRSIGALLGGVLWISMQGIDLIKLDKEEGGTFILLFCRIS
jgi:hypothetical protein